MRDVYDIDDLLVMVATDRISDFDVVLPKGIPFKGQVLNQIAEYFLDATRDIVPNWKVAVPDPMATVGKKCQPLKSASTTTWPPASISSQNNNRHRLTLQSLRDYTA